MAINYLGAAVTPPASANPVVQVDWDAAECELGVRLPDDYKDVVTVYGTVVSATSSTLTGPSRPARTTSMISRCRGLPSPPVQGRRLGQGVEREVEGTTPARARTTADARRPPARSRNYPRECGDDGVHGRDHACAEELPPPARGRRPCCRSACCTGRTTPASAGTTSRIDRPVDRTTGRHAVAGPGV